MRRLTVFNNITLDGYFTGENGDLTWTRNGAADPEWTAFVAENVRAGGVLVFGRLTYEMMAGYWPTPEAAKIDPVVAGQMNARPKVVFSRTLRRAKWKNTKVMTGEAVDGMKALKGESGDDLVILGSGRLVSHLTWAGLIDEYQLVVNPVVLGKGRTMFERVGRKLDLRQTKTRTFANGNVLICYEV